jgi:mediator of replication checkpoint protein 1
VLYHRHQDKILISHSEKAKADDEKNINQLYKDIMNGGLRKRRGGDAFDVSDSEDEVEQRRRKRRMEFQKMTKALISDERIGKIAQNPKQAAFFHTLADHFEDPEYEFLDAPEMDVDGEASQSQSDEAKEGEISVPDSQTVDAAAPINPLKRKSTDSQEKENRPPPHMRRTVLPDNMSRKPMTLADVQHSVQELLDDNRIVVPDSQYSDSDSELEIVPSETTSRKPIIDRLSMSRTASNSESAVDSNLAFVAPAAGVHQPGFRVPSLVRRATSNLSAVSTSTSGVSTPVEGTVVRRGGTGRSNIHAQAREAERRAALEKVEKKRKETLKKKVGKARGQRSVLRCLDGGFE